MISSFSGGGNCVRIELSEGGTASISHSQDRSQPVLIIGGQQYDAFLLALRSGNASEGRVNGLAWSQDDIRVSLHNSDGALSFTSAEWRAFVHGVDAGEFDRA